MKRFLEKLFFVYYRRFLLGCWSIGLLGLFLMITSVFLENKEINAYSVEEIPPVFVETPTPVPTPESSMVLEPSPTPSPTENPCRQMIARVSAYSSTPDQTWGDPFTTFTGTRCRWGTMATDPKVIPLGSIIFVPGRGWGRAEDTGGEIIGNLIDIWFPTRKAAIEWGVQWLEVEVCHPSR